MNTFSHLGRWGDITNFFQPEGEFTQLNAVLSCPPPQEDPSLGEGVNIFEIIFFVCALWTTKIFSCGLVTYSNLSKEKMSESEIEGIHNKAAIILIDKSKACLSFFVHFFDIDTKMFFTLLLGELITNFLLENVKRKTTPNTAKRNRFQT